MRKYLYVMLLAVGVLGLAAAQAEKPPGETPPLGLPPVPYPEDNPQTADEIALRDMIDWCLQQPLEAEPLELDDSRMVAIEAYVTYERRGVTLAPGKH